MHPSDLPWRPQELILLTSALLLGAVLIGASWYGASGTGLLSHQVLWLNVAVLGLIVTFGAGGTWILTGRRAVGQRSTRLLGPFSPGQAVATGPLADGDAHDAAADPPAVDELVSGPQMTRYHRADCWLATGKHVQSAGRIAHEAAGRVACGMCAP